MGDTSPSFAMDPPLAPPPPGVTPNFEHPASRAYQAYIGSGVCLGLAFFILLLRLSAKWRVLRTWRIDDYACALSFALLVSYVGMSFFLLRPGGINHTHIWEMRASNVSKDDLSVTVAASCLYSAAAACVKLSLFLVYLRLFKPNKISRWLIYSGMTICVAFYISNIISVCVLCMPLPGQRHDLIGWALRSKECGPKNLNLALVQAAFGTASDIYLFIIPIYSIFQLQLPLQRKIGVSAIFLVGVIAIVCSIMNLAYRARTLSLTDKTWASVDVYTTSVGEIAAGIICSCMPMLPSLFQGSSSTLSKRVFRLSSLSPRYWWRRASSRGSRSDVPLVRSKASKAQNKGFHALHLGWTQNPRSGLWTDTRNEPGTPARSTEEGDDDRAPGLNWIRMDEKARARVEDRV